ncbi:hypothetical protein GCM10027047_22490 [Rhodococcus aerolatus]
MSDPLVDPDDPTVLSPQAARALAEQVEDAQLAAGAVRYGRVTRVGCARVVLNPSSPLPTGSFAVGLDATSAAVGRTLLALETTFADAGRSEALVHASPTTVPEIQGLADDAGWFAVAESLVVVRLSAPEEPALPVREARDADLPGVAELLADAVDLPEDGLPSLVRLLGHRLDDPRSHVLLVDDGDLDRLAGVAVGHGGGAVGLLEHVVVRAARQRRGIGTALVDALGGRLLAAGATLLAAQVTEAAAEEHLAEACDFTTAYPVTTYARRVDEEAGFGEE